MAQFTFNNAEHLMTKVTLFYANYGYHPLLYGQPQKSDSVSKAAEQTMKKLKNLHKQLSKDINFMNLWSTIYYNKGHMDGSILKRGEKVFLL